MPFNIEQWKKATRHKLKGWKGRLERAGVNNPYYFLVGISFLPVAQAVYSGDCGALAVLGGTLGSEVRTNLLANIVQKVKDKDEIEVARIIESEAPSTPQLKIELDVLLVKLDSLHEAQKTFSGADNVWFIELIQRELKNIKSGIKFEAKLIGGSGIAQGNGAIALRKNAKYTRGNYTEYKYENDCYKKLNWMHSVIKSLASL